VNEKSRMDLEREIVDSVKREMEKPRMTASVRNALEAEAALALKHPAVRSAIA
jgi:hypothetical protein